MQYRHERISHLLAEYAPGKGEQTWVMLSMLGDAIG